MIIRGVLPILDIGPYVTRDRAPDVARELFKGGARAIQLRAKAAISDRDLLQLARTIRTIARENDASFFVNDRPDIAMLTDADGVHLGQTDLPPREVRAWLPASIAIGVSCHSVQDVERALAEGIASYLGFGPIFATTTKQNPDPVVGSSMLAEVVAAHRETCIVAIGGVTVERLSEVAATGVPAVAMISDLLSASDIEARMRAAAAAFR
jgi:thiamine-phosphate pyrophosphorylase